MITFSRQFGRGRHLTAAPELLFAAGLCTVQCTSICRCVQMMCQDQADCTYKLELLWCCRTPRAPWLFPQYLSACRKWGLNWNWFGQAAASSLASRTVMQSREHLSSWSCPCHVSTCPCKTIFPWRLKIGLKATMRPNPSSCQGGLW